MTTPKVSADGCREILRRYGYDPGDPVPRDDEGQRILPDRLLEALADAPVVPHRRISALQHMTDARRYAARHTSR
jgi:hypothetical protein